MTDRKPMFAHGPDTCHCIISAGCLKEARQRRMVPLEAVAAASGYAREYLAGVERGEEGRCVELAVIRAYEEAMGTTVEAEMLDIMSDILRAADSAHEMLARLHLARQAEQPQL